MTSSMSSNAAPGLVFVQRRPGRAGAQTCLLRLTDALRAGGRAVALVVDADGWLSEAARTAGLTVEVVPFPSPRSLGGRLFFNGAWARRVAARLSARGFSPDVVVGNDHQEAPLARALARKLGRPSAVILRSSGMSAGDFAKYGCGSCDVVFAIGAALQARVAGFPGGAGVKPLVDGLSPSDFAAHRPLPAHLPECALVIGTPHPDKGWGDLVAALARLPRHSPLAALRFDFTATPSAAEAEALGLAGADPARFRVLERTTRFAERLADYDLVIHPSRRETFGMAALEALAAGVPVVSSDTGVLARAIGDDRFAFAPGDVDALAVVLTRLPDLWPDLVAAMPAIGARLAAEHGIARTLSLFDAGLANLPSPRLR